MRDPLCPNRSAALMHSYYEATARERIAGILDHGSFREILPPSARLLSPHLQALELPVAFDDGVVIGTGTLDGLAVHIAAQEGGFMGGAVGEVHGAKLVGLLTRAQRTRAAGVLLLLETGGVRLQEANAGLIGVSEIIRAILATRTAGIPVLGAIGGQYGCFGGMGIAASCCSGLVMSEEGRLGLSGPEVIETAHGVDEFDSQDRALVWRTSGGKHRYLLGDADELVDDDIGQFRAALACAMHQGDEFNLAALLRHQATLEARLADFGAALDSAEIWKQLSFDDPEAISLLDAQSFRAQAKGRRAV
jgi:malonate decarboxylase beta subunit